MDILFLRNEKNTVFFGAKRILFSSVSPHVAIQRLLEGKRLRANIAFEGLQAGMTAHMSLENLTVRRFVVAFGARNSVHENVVLGFLCRP